MNEMSTMLRPMTVLEGKPSIAGLKGKHHVCRHCCTSIGDAPYVREGEEYCCEGCFLADRKQHASATAVDDASFVLAEALVEALDAREHETSLHSKRVACHTLVMAKHFTDDPRLLHQVYWGRAAA